MQVPKLTVEGVTLLNVARLKEELKRRGRSIAGKKADLQARLKEAIVLNVLVASGGGESVRRHESMSGLDITARWELLTVRCGKFKRLGDGLQGDCIADNGYTWDF